MKRSTKTLITLTTDEVQAVLLTYIVEEYPELKDVIPSVVWGENNVELTYEERIVKDEAEPVKQKKNKAGIKQEAIIPEIVEATEENIPDKIIQIATKEDIPLIKDSPFAPVAPTTTFNLSALGIG